MDRNHSKKQSSLVCGAKAAYRARPEVLNYIGKAKEESK
jgi:hypothetical protein